MEFGLSFVEFFLRFELIWLWKDIAFENKIFFYIIFDLIRGGLYMKNGNVFLRGVVFEGFKGLE